MSHNLPALGNQDQTGSIPGWAKRLGKLTAIAATYYIVGKLGLLLAISPGFATAVWPASGIALAGTLLFGYRVWPGILLGSFLTNISTCLEITGAASIQLAIGLATSIGIGAALQAMAGAFLIRRFAKYPTLFIEARDAVKLLLLGGPLSCVVNAIWGTASLLLAGVIGPADYFFHWWTWWVGDSIGVITFTPLILIWAGKPSAVLRHRKISVSVLVSLAFILVVAFFAYTDAWERDRAKLTFGRRTDRMTLQVEQNFDHYIDILRSLESLYASSGSVSRQDFKTFVSRWFSIHPGIRTLSWNPRVPDSERARYEQAARLDGLNNFQILDQGPQGQLIRAGRRAEYFPIYYFESRGGNKRSLGFDVAVDPARRKALDRARDTGEPTATDRITLIKDVEREPSFLVFLPIFRSRVDHNVEERRRNLQGYVSAAFRVRDIISNILASGRQVNDIALRFYDAESGGDKDALAQQRAQKAKPKIAPIKPAAVYGEALKRNVSIEIAQHRWILEFTPTSGYVMAQRRWQAWSVLAGGLLFTGLLGSFLLSATGYNLKLQAVNTDLEKEITERMLAQDKITRFADIVDSLEEAIIGSTWEGIITTWNKGAEIMYGYVADEVMGRSISILHPPDLPDEQLRLRQKVERGEPVRQYETLRIRKDGTRVNVSLTLSLVKDSAGKIVGVASVSSDITARKRAETQLQQHREAVARRLHDSVLQTLTAIGMHLELAQIQLSENPDAVSRHLLRIEHAINEEQQNLRSFVRELHGVGIDKLVEDFKGTQALQELVKRLESQWGVSVELELKQDLSCIAQTIADDLVYIVQEGVANAVRHGRASLVKIAVASEAQKLVMSITDNGRGFPFRGFYDAAALDAMGAGPATLKSRIASLGGSLSIRSADSGACLELTLPLSHREL
ncbi:MAG: CHASE domain-containing protein [Deltaproteobacteria bacterium]